MRTILLIFIFALMPGIASVYGQVNLSEMNPESTDSLVKSRIHCFSPGIGGKNIVWDFSQKLKSRESSKVFFLKDSSGVVSVVEPGTISYYHVSSDTLMLLGSESPLEKRNYVSRRISKMFPLEYGDSINIPFLCEGVYCGEHLFREVGTTTVKVDADGSIALAENDTLWNVRRVHTIDSYSICMDISYEALDTAKLTQVVDERYEWYLPNTQYPIFETMTSTTYLNQDIAGTTKFAYCNLPEDRAAYYIIPEEKSELEEEDSGSYVEDEQIPDILHYKIETSGKTVHLTYDLDEEAVLGTIIVSHMGVLCVNRQWTQEAGRGYSVQIDCSGLRPGIYILHITVNGKIYSEKVTL